MRRALTWIGLAIAAVLLIGIVGGLIWTQLGPDPTADAIAVAESADETGNGWTAFGPARADVGVVLYPGARIDAAAYAPAARSLSAQSGARVVVIDAPLDIALLDIDAADPVREAHPDIDRWVVGGHSLGGVAAARYATAGDIDGLLLWASYPAGGDEIPAAIATTSITGDRDQVLNRDAYDAARDLLPGDADFVELAGVNHAQFGDYGAQSGDGTAAVDDLQAREAIVEASAALVERVMTGPDPVANEHFWNPTTSAFLDGRAGQHPHRRASRHVPTTTERPPARIHIL